MRRARERANSFAQSGFSFISGLRNNKPTPDKTKDLWLRIKILLEKRDFNDKDKILLNKLIPELGKNIIDCEIETEGSFDEMWELIFRENWLWKIANAVNLGGVPCRESTLVLIETLLSKSVHNLLPCKGFLEPLDQLLEFCFCLPPIVEVLRVLRVIVNKCRTDKGVTSVFFHDRKLSFFNYLLPLLLGPEDREDVSISREILFACVRLPDKDICNFTVDHTDFVQLLVKSLCARFKALKRNSRAKKAASAFVEKNTYALPSFTKKNSEAARQKHNVNDKILTHLTDWVIIVSSLASDAPKKFSISLANEIKITFLESLILPSLLKEKHYIKTSRICVSVINHTTDKETLLNWANMLFHPDSVLSGVLFNRICPSDSSPSPKASSATLELLNAILSTRLYEIYDLLFFRYLRTGSYLIPESREQLNLHSLRYIDTADLIAKYIPKLARWKNKKSYQKYKQDAQLLCARWTLDYEQWFNNLFPSNVDKVRNRLSNADETIQFMAQQVIMKENFKNIEEKAVENNEQKPVANIIFEEESKEMEVVTLKKNETNMDDLIFDPEDNTTSVLVLENETNLDELIGSEERKENKKFSEEGNFVIIPNQQDEENEINFQIKDEENDSDFEEESSSSENDFIDPSLMGLSQISHENEKINEEKISEKKSNKVEKNKENTNISETISQDFIESKEADVDPETTHNSTKTRNTSENSESVLKNALYTALQNSHNNESNMEQILEQAMFEKRLSPKEQNTSYQPFANNKLSPKMKDSSTLMNAYLEMSQDSIGDIGPCLTTLLRRLSLILRFNFNDNLPLCSVLICLIRCPSPLLHEFLLVDTLETMPTILRLLSTISSLYSELFTIVEDEYPGETNNLIKNCRKNLVLEALSNRPAKLAPILLHNKFRNMEGRFTVKQETDNAILNLIFLEELLKEICVTIDTKHEFHQDLTAVEEDEGYVCDELP